MPHSLKVDGACMGLKAKVPLIVVNTRARSEVRIRFTIAHELGHVLLPWHTGDSIDESIEQYELESCEKEANAFAAQILAPSAWAREFFSKHIEGDHTLSEAIKLFADAAQVSKYTGLFRFIEIAEPGYLFAFIDIEGQVQRQWKSKGTLAVLPKHIEAPSSFRVDNLKTNLCMDDEWSGTRVCVWQVESELELVKPSTSYGWKDLRDKIISDLCEDGNRRVELRNSLSGVIASANGCSKGLSPEARHSMILQRLSNKALNSPDFKKIVEHNLFPEMVTKWVQSHR